MTKIKAFTDLYQSKKLAEILPLESADMFYNLGESKIPNFIYSSHSDFECYTMCWSLAALLDFIQEPDLVQNSEGTWLLHSWVKAYPWSVGGYSNPVDACYEMILKLHELKML